MEWIYTKDSLPLTYKTGDWDGKNSDQVIAEDADGKLYLAHFCDGFMDGSAFEDWYDDKGFSIDKKIFRFIKIPL